jgi:hypothetical protein
MLLHKPMSTLWVREQRGWTAEESGMPVRSDLPRKPRRGRLSGDQKFHRVVALARR